MAEKNPKFRTDMVLVWGVILVILGVLLQAVAAIFRMACG
jgi:hypothetical protein